MSTDGKRVERAQRGEKAYIETMVYTENADVHGQTLWVSISSFEIGCRT